LFFKNPKNSKKQKKPQNSPLLPPHFTTSSSFPPKIFLLFSFFPFPSLSFPSLFFSFLFLLLVCWFSPRRPLRFPPASFTFFTFFPPASFAFPLHPLSPPTFILQLHSLPLPPLHASWSCSPSLKVSGSLSFVLCSFVPFVPSFSRFLILPPAISVPALTPFYSSLFTSFLEQFLPFGSFLSFPFLSFPFLSFPFLSFPFPFHPFFNLLASCSHTLTEVLPFPSSVLFLFSELPLQTPSSLNFTWLL